MPSLGADMEAGTLVEWRIKPGDEVKRGDIAATVETEKATLDIEVWQGGVVEELLVQPGTKVAVGVVLARLRAPGEAPHVPLGAPRTACTSSRRSSLWASGRAEVGAMR